MATTSIGSSGVTFPDATTQSSAGGPYVGERGQLFTASGTFTVPAGVTAVKVTCMGGGGGSAGTSRDAGGGGTGGTSSFGALASATGGTGGNPNNSGNNPGLGATGGTASSTLLPQSGNGGWSPGVYAIDSAYSKYGWTGTTLGAAGGRTYGNKDYGAGGIGTYVNSCCGNFNSGSGGGSGACNTHWITGLTPSGTQTVTVGAAGTAGGSGGFGPAGGAGKAGFVLVEW